MGELDFKEEIKFMKPIPLCKTQTNVLMANFISP